MRTSHAGGESVREHYARLAPRFLSHWIYSNEFVEWMSTRLRHHADVEAQTRLLDLGSGPALYARHLAGYTGEPVTCVDPSTELLAQIPNSPKLYPVRAAAEDVATGKIALPHQTYDAIVVKEAIHHVPKAQRIATLRGLGSETAVFIGQPNRRGYSWLDFLLNCAQKLCW